MQLEKRNMSITAIVLVALAGAMIGIGLCGCKKDEPKKEDIPISVFLGDKLCKHTKIAFVSDRGGNSEIYVMNADGAELTRLTDNPGVDGYPSWSPDGKRIVFRSYRDENLDIYVMNADGSGQESLTSNPDLDEFSAWSPDGKRIAFTSSRDGKSELYVMNADGAGQTRLTDGLSGHPSWSPDGKKSFCVDYQRKELGNPIL